MKFPFTLKKIVKSSWGLRTLPIYKNKYSIFFLVQYDLDYIDDVTDFIIGCSHKPIEIINVHKLEEVNNKKDEFAQSLPYQYNERYYMVISALNTDLHYMYENVNISNSILQSITNDIYNNCSSSLFSDDLFNHNILDMNKFKYKNIEPPFDDLCECDSIKSYNHICYDNIELILNKLPSGFASTDLFNMIHVYNYDSGSWRTSSLRLILYYYENKYENNILTSLIKNSNLLKYFSDSNDIESLKYLISPIYLRTDAPIGENKLNGDKSIEEMDEIFQQEYDRFTQPTADYMNNYKLEDIVD